MVITCPSIQAHHNEVVLCLNFGTPENNEFSIWNKWKIYCFWVSQYLSTLGYLLAKREGSDQMAPLFFVSALFTDVKIKSSKNLDTVFDLISAHFPISAQYDNV